MRSDRAEILTKSCICDNMKKKFLFHYRIDNVRGSVMAVSAPQAMDLAKVDYLARHKKMPVNDPKFRYNKSLLEHVDIDLAEVGVDRLKKLYRYYQQGVIDSGEMDELTQLQEIVRNENVKRGIK